MKAWKYKLDKAYTLTHPILAGITYSNDWVKISNSKMVISKDYAWDGCSPKFTFLGLFSFGTPDGISYLGYPWLYHPSLVHDVFCQFRKEIPISKEHVVTIWEDMLVARKWPLTKLYVFFVDKFGPQDFKE